MKKIVVISDTHGKKDRLRLLVSTLRESDYVFFLGDCIPDILDLERECADTEFFIVKGNCDFFSTYPEELTAEIEGVKILITHGHRYGVKGGTRQLTARARELGCVAAFFGHSHIAENLESEGVRLCNPGSLASPRIGKPSYAYALINDGRLTVSIVELN